MEMDKLIFLKILLSVAITLLGYHIMFMTDKYYGTDTFIGKHGFVIVIFGITLVLISFGYVLYSVVDVFKIAIMFLSNIL